MAFAIALTIALWRLWDVPIIIAGVFMAVCMISAVASARDSKSN